MPLNGSTSSLEEVDEARPLGRALPTKVEIPRAPLLNRVNCRTEEVTPAVDRPSSAKFSRYETPRSVIYIFTEIFATRRESHEHFSLRVSGSPPGGPEPELRKVRHGVSERPVRARVSLPFHSTGEATTNFAVLTPPGERARPIYPPYCSVESASDRSTPSATLLSYIFFPSDIHRPTHFPLPSARSLRTLQLSLNRCGWKTKKKN